MKILLINYSDIGGGAASFSKRLLDGLNSEGVDAYLAVVDKKTDNIKVIQVKNTKKVIDAIPNLLYVKRKKLPFSCGFIGSSIKDVIEEINPDIVHLNWINGGFVSIKEIGKINKPIVWTLHDSWFFTGGCHIPNDCKRYMKCCGKCPNLGSSFNYDMSRFVICKKKKEWKKLKINLVCPSNWLMRNLKKSSIVSHNSVYTIHNGVSLSEYYPCKNTNKLREKYGIGDKKVILYGSAGILKDENKGLGFMEEIYNRLPIYIKNSVQMVAFGANKVISNSLLLNNTKFVGIIKDESIMREIYSLADVFIMTSKSENLPFTAIESMACGTPVIAFSTGGIPEIIQKNTGFLINKYKIDMYVKKIIKILEPNMNKKMSKYSVKNVTNNFNINNTVKEYILLYKAVLNNEDINNHTII